MARALGIISFSENHIWVDGLEDYRSIAAFSFLGRYRVIDFPISNMSNSGIDRIQVYIRRRPQSLVEPHRNRPSFQHQLQERICKDDVYRFPGGERLL